MSSAVASTRGSAPLVCFSKALPAGVFTCHVLAGLTWLAICCLISAEAHAEHFLGGVFGAICGYLLLGMAWGVLYSMLDTARPGSFEVGGRLGEQVGADHSRIPLFTYYSFI